MDRFASYDSLLCRRYFKKANEIKEDYETIYFYRAFACQKLGDFECYEDQMMRAIIPFDTSHYAIMYYQLHWNQMLSASQDPILRQKIIERLNENLKVLKDIASVKYPIFNKDLPPIHQMSADQLLSKILSGINVNP